MTYTVNTRKPARVTTYPGRGPDGSDRRYIVGPVKDAKAMLATMLEGNPGAMLVWETADHSLDCARYEVLLPNQDRSGE